MKTQSAKAKGRRLQQWGVQQLIETFDIHPEDIKSHPNFIEPLTEYQIDKILDESEDYYG